MPVPCSAVSWIAWTIIHAWADTRNEGVRGRSPARKARKILNSSPPAYCEGFTRGMLGRCG